MAQEENAKEENGTGRLEAFSDGIFAVAITLLVLDIHVPHVELGLGRELLKQWPVYLAYGTSFSTILIMWINHHKLFRHIQRADHGLLINGLLLMGITLVPFPTALVSEYLNRPNLADARIAAALLNGLSVLIAVLLNLVWRHASRHGRLLSANPDRMRVQQITNQYRFGPLLYGIGVALAFVNVYASVGMSFALALFFALPEKPD